MTMLPIGVIKIAIIITHIVVGDIDDVYFNGYSSYLDSLAEFHRGKKRGPYGTPFGIH